MDLLVINGDTGESGYGSKRVEEVMRDTWGHLDAAPGVRYPGYIIFAEGAYGGERIILKSEFGDAGYGPWFYEGIHNWLCDQKIESGRIYRFEGFYRLKDDEHQFVGDISTMEI